jgi:hypothetical protein
MVRSTITMFALLSIFAFATSAQTRSLLQGNKFKGYAYSAQTGKVKGDALFLIKDGTISLFGDKPGYLMSHKLYADVEITMEYRWNDEETHKASTKRNSGVMYCIPAEAKDTLWPKGFQYQIKDNATGDFVLLQDVTLTMDGTVQGPGKSVVVKRLAGNENPSGQWNSIRIVIKGSSIEQYLNDTLVNKSIQASVSKGRLLFQYEGYPIEFRNIEIRCLSFNKKRQVANK